MSPYTYINNMFSAQAARTGGIVRRKVQHVEKCASLSFLLREVEARGFHLIQTGDQYIVICNPGAFKLHC